MTVGPGPWPGVGLPTRRMSTSRARQPDDPISWERPPRRGAASTGAPVPITRFFPEHRVHSEGLRRVADVRRGPPSQRTSSPPPFGSHSRRRRARDRSAQAVPAAAFPSRAQAGERVRSVAVNQHVRPAKHAKNSLGHPASAGRAGRSASQKRLRGHGGSSHHGGSIRRTSASETCQEPRCAGPREHASGLENTDAGEWSTGATRADRACSRSASASTLTPPCSRPWAVASPTRKPSLTRHPRRPAG